MLSEVGFLLCFFHFFLSIRLLGLGGERPVPGMGG